MRGKKKRGESRVAGTQQFDELWTWCNGFICGRLKTRINGLPNPHLFNQAYQYEQCRQRLVQALGYRTAKMRIETNLVRKKRVLQMMTRRIPCKYHCKCVSAPVLMALRGHFANSDVNNTLRRLKNPWQAAAENVDFVRGLEHPCYLVFSTLSPAQ